MDWNDANLDGTFAAGERTGSIEYLIDNSNFTGYQQTILEVTKNAAGQATKRISYTFGTDEITQTVSLIDSGSQLITQSSTLTYGHDGRGSVQVLFDAAAAIAQVYTYSAYGELLAIHTGSAAVVGTVGQANLESLAATNKLYNGEGFDTRTGLYNFRARNYSASLGRFERLDPFSGNATDPFSFNKYGFVHGNPVMGADPTGMFFSLAGFFLAAALNSGVRGEATKMYFQFFGDVAAQANEQFGATWKYIQIAGLATGIGIAGVLSGKGLFTYLRNMLPFLAKRATEFLERGIVLVGREAFETLSESGQLAVKEAAKLRAKSPFDGRNVAAISYSIRDSSGKWVSQEPMAAWSLPGRGSTISLHSEQVLLKRIQAKHGTNYRVDSVFSERVPCTDKGHNCALVFADQESIQGSSIELVHFGIDPGTGSVSAIRRAWEDSESWL